MRQFPQTAKNACRDPIQNAISLQIQSAVKFVCKTQESQNHQGGCGPPCAVKSCVSLMTKCTTKGSRCFDKISGAHEFCRVISSQTLSLMIVGVVAAIVFQLQPPTYSMHSPRLDRACKRLPPVYDQCCRSESSGKLANRFCHCVKAVELQILSPGKSADF